ncbi:uncharacterized protein [Apostichopus japonicus]|uniref:uncharacterized protein n=1 Tax=Stichopus japonicus TaxID=307972 RepID=UPI003AB43CED
MADLHVAKLLIDWGLEELGPHFGVDEEEEIAFVKLPLELFQSRHTKKKGRGYNLHYIRVSDPSLTYNLTSPMLEQFCSRINEDERSQPFILVLWEEKSKTRQFFRSFWKGST